MNVTSNLSERIRQIRLQKGLSQENMADMLGLSTTAYGDMERGRTELSVSRLENVAKLLDVPLPELLGFEPYHVGNGMAAAGKHEDSRPKTEGCRMNWTNGS